MSASSYRRGPFRQLRSGPAAWLLSFVVVLAGLLALAGRLERGAIYNWDLLGYLGCLFELETHDPVEIHRRVLDVVHQEVPADVRPRLLAAADFRQHPDYPWGRQVATEPDAFVAQLGWYRSRIGFTAGVALAHQGFGRTPLASVRAVVTASYVALGLVLWAWTGRRLGPWLAAALALAAAASEPLAGVAKLHTADLPATVLVMAGLWTLLTCRRAEPTLAFWLAAVLVRPDLAITGSLVLLVAAASPRLVERSSRALLASAAAGLPVVSWVLGAWTGHPGWTKLFSFTFVERRVDLSDAGVDFGQYLTSFTGTAWDLGSSSTPFFAAAAVLLCLYLPRRTAEEVGRHRLTVALTAAFLIRFLLFPVIWDRFWLPLDLWVVVVLVLLVAPAMPRRTAAPA